MRIKDLIPWNRRDSEVARRGEAIDKPALALQREVNRLFDRFWDRFGGADGTRDTSFEVGAPRTDIAETDSGLEVTIELPGMDENDIDVSVTDDVLTIKGEKKAEREDKAKGYLVAERTYGSFYRAIPLPSGLVTDDARATFKKGILTVRLPKSPEAQAKARKVTVTSD